MKNTGKPVCDYMETCIDLHILLAELCDVLKSKKYSHEKINYLLNFHFTFFTKL
jgi:hypothetical protein